ncbi:hypothetical protein [Burkholderia ubonensis]|uniref:hypothetical protein n=1 Tax=Burkholderia ubonensis TaxID=101571 RepID=UPI000A4B49BF|nr:hypothetical protein [Burkholderia ubonensis]
MNADVSEWAKECLVYANAFGLIDLPYFCEDADADRLLTLYANGIPAMVAARAMFVRH